MSRTWKVCGMGIIMIILSTEARQHGWCEIGLMERWDWAEWLPHGTGGILPEAYSPRQCSAEISVLGLFKVV